MSNERELISKFETMINTVGTTQRTKRLSFHRPYDARGLLRYPVASQ